MQPTSRFIPQNARPLVHPDGLGVVYAYERNGAHCAVAYAGKSSKSTWNFSFGAQRNRMYERAAEFFVGLEEREARKVERKAERTQPHTLMVGTIVYNSWGYDQTNIDFYVVVKCSANFVWLQPLAQETTETGFMCGNTQPVQPIQQITERRGEPLKPEMHRVGMFDGQPSVNFKHGCGCVWDGKPERCSWYA